MPRSWQAKRDSHGVILVGRRDAPIEKRMVCWSDEARGCHQEFPYPAGAIFAENRPIAPSGIHRWLIGAGIV